MKIPALLLLAVSLSVARGTLRAADYVTTVENTPGLLGYWRYTPGTGANSSVNGYTGTFVGDAALGAAGTGPALADDPTNRPVTLDGTSGTYVNTNLVGGIGSAGSIVGWFNLAALPSSVGRTFYVAGESQSGNDLDLQIGSDNVLRFYTAGSVSDPTAFSAADLNHWIFFAATFTSNATASIYINGVNVVTGNMSGTHGPGGTFSMGESDVFTGRLFQGGLDEIATYNRELSAAQVASIYNSASIVPEPSTWAGAVVGIGLLSLLWRRRASGRISA